MCSAAVGGGGGRLADSWYRCIGGIKQQLCQYSRLPKSSERAGIHKDFAMTGLNGSAVWFSQILWLNNSMIHILSALKSPILSFKSLPSGQGTFFFSRTVPLSLLAAFSCSSPAAFSPAFPSSLLPTSAEVWVFPPPPPLQRLAWPKALIAKLVYIGEINALQMRLNTFSKKMQTVRVRIITQVGGGISVAQSCRARVKPADTVRLIHFSGEREEDLAFAC